MPMWEQQGSMPKEEMGYTHGNVRQIKCKATFPNVHRHII